jgi:L-amino acid N-acyltransferase YncA
MKLLDVLPDNVEQLGFFCQMSRRKYPGWQRKLAWARNRLKEGMRIKLLGQGERGFIEYIPGEYAWRPVEARDFMVIHCLWVVGKSKGKGHGDRLVEACLADARRAGMSGVAMVTSEGNWLAGSRLLSKHGFEAVDRVEPSFTLMVHRFKGTRTPRFTGHWSEKARRFGKGLTVIRSDQCPYNEDAVENLLAAAGEHGVPIRVVELNSAADVRTRSPSPYGTFGVVLDGRLVSYHYLLRKDADSLLKSGR